MRILSMRGLCVLAVAAVLGTASLAGATQFSLSGSDHPEGYAVFFYAGSTAEDPTDWRNEAIAVTQKADPWVQGSWMTFENPNQGWPMDQHPGSGNLPGTYTYLTSFYLDGFSPDSAVIKGYWASDNGSQVYFNDLPIGSTPAVPDTSFLRPIPFEITSGFNQGLNVLRFDVYNESWGTSGINPTGLLVFIESASADPVPEPATVLLLSGGMVGIALARRRIRG